MSSSVRVIPATRHDIRPFLLSIHYARRMPSVSFSFGLYVDEVIEGVCCFGTPAGAPQRSGVCGDDFSKYVIELNRLCLKRNIKNHASMLVGRSLAMIKKNAIVLSYADTSMGHIGYVYQATNFIYCGLSEKRTDWALKSRPGVHGQTIGDEFRGQQSRSKLMREKYGDDFYLKPRPRKHRYVFFTGEKKFKKSARNALRYNVLDYPKQKQEQAA